VASMPICVVFLTYSSTVFSSLMAKGRAVGATPTILCVGTVTLDMVLTTDYLPREDERVEADQVSLGGGGNAANTAATIARLGLPVEFCGTVGTDVAGELIAGELESAGVGTRYLHRSRDATTAQSAVIVSAGGARTIVTRPAPRPPAIPSGFDVVHLDKAGWAGVPPGGIQGSRLSLDDGNPVDGLDVSLLTWYVPTAATLRTRYQTMDAVAAAQHAKRAGAANVIVTDGAGGSFAVDNDGLYFAPALSISPMSTLGAGDVFHGAVIAAIAMGQPLAEAIRFANVTAGLSCRALDGRSGVPHSDEVERVLRDLDGGHLTDEQIVRRFSTAEPG
jgi:sulfofructose kinase